MHRPYGNLQIIPSFQASFLYLWFHLFTGIIIGRKEIFFSLMQRNVKSGNLINYSSSFTIPVTSSYTSRLRNKRHFQLQNPKTNQTNTPLFLVLPVVIKCKFSYNLMYNLGTCTWAP